MFHILGTIPYSQGVPYSWLRSVFLAAFRGLRCAFCQLHSSALHPTLVQNNGIAKTATFGSSAEKKGKELPENGHLSRISKPFCMLSAVVRNASEVQRLNCRNCQTNPATCNESAEQNSKDSPWRSFLVDRICQDRIWYAHTNEIRCYGKDRDYETISNKSEEKVKLLTSIGITCNNIDEDTIASGYFSVHFFYTQQNAKLHE